jgi:hypothetical protein
VLTGNSSQLVSEVVGFRSIIGFKIELNSYIATYENGHGRNDEMLVGNSECLPRKEGRSKFGQV